MSLFCHAVQRFEPGILPRNPKHLPLCHGGSSKPLCCSYAVCLVTWRNGRRVPSLWVARSAPSLAGHLFRSCEAKSEKSMIARFRFALLHFPSRINSTRFHHKKILVSVISKGSRTQNFWEKIYRCRKQTHFPKGFVTFWGISV